MISVKDALAQILAAASPRGRENVPLADALGRRLAESLRARRTQPPVAISAMDGFALRAADLAAPERLRLIGTSAAGHGFAGALGPGETVRIFTGAPVPEGADAVLIQEDANVEGDFVLPLRESIEPGRNIRDAGIDFTEGVELLPAGTWLGPIEIALAAAMDHAELPVIRRPRVAILTTGDELVPPGHAAGRDRIVASNAPAVAAYAQLAGGVPLDLGIAGDNFAALEAGIRAAREKGADVLVTLGGASVGDHDLVKSALAAEGMELGFWRIAMRPGKPLIHGRLGNMLILGLPGNPAASIVCSLLFLLPLLRALSGDPTAADDESEPALLGAALPTNGSREDYMRAKLENRGESLPIATPFPQQDSSLLSVFSKAQCLVIRPPNAPAAREGDSCRVLRLRHFLA